MNNNYIKPFAAVVMIAMIFASCKVTQTYQKPDARVDGLYRDISSGDTAAIANLTWKQLFEDPNLQNLIQEGVEQNLNLKIAYTRIQQSEAYYKQSEAAFLPGLNAAGSAAFNKLSEGQGGNFIRNTSVYQLGLNSSWEADIWGKLNSAKRAGLASLLESRDYARAVQTELVADIAVYYYSLLALDQQLAITQQTVTNWISSVETMRALKDAAKVTGAAVVQSEANRYAAEVTIPDLKLSIRQTENALSTLLGRTPGPIARSDIKQQSLPSVLQVGIPVQLLGNRPDVRQAENNFRYYFENTNIARASFYPSLTISASGGLSNINLQNYFSPGSVFASIAGGLTQPILNKRINKTRLEVAKAAQQESLLSFQNTLLIAGQEVSDAISSYQAATEKTSVRTNQLASLQKSIEFTQELLKYGSANYTEVLNAQQSYLGAQLGQVNDRLQQLQSVVELYRALGGGWK